MSKADALLILPMIGDILGIRNVNSLVERDRNALEELANNALEKWNDKLNKYNYSGGNLASGKPDYSWLKRQLFEEQTQKVYEFKREMDKARKIDANKSQNLGLANIAKDVGQYVLDVGKQAGNIGGSIVSLFDKEKGKWVQKQVDSGINYAGDQINRWGNDETYKVIDKYKNQFNQNKVQNKLDQINKQQIASHNSNRRALQQYKKGK